MSLILAVSFTLAGCHGDGGNDPGIAVQPPEQQSVEKYAVSGTISNPSGGMISGNLTLSAIDKNGATVKLYSDKTGGTQIRIATAPVGLISFFVDDTATLPVTVKVVAEATGLVSSSATVVIDKAGPSSFAIKMVDPTSTTTAGVTSGKANVDASATTGLAAPLTTNVSTTDTSKSEATVSRTAPGLR